MQRRRLPLRLRGEHPQPLRPHIPNPFSVAVAKRSARTAAACLLTAIWLQLRVRSSITRRCSWRRWGRGGGCASHVTEEYVTRHTSHIARHTPHVTRHTSHVTRHTSHVTRHASFVTRHTSHVIRHTSHVTRHTSHVTRHTSHVTCHMSQY